MRALSITDVAAELGKSNDWLYRHWETLAKSSGFPRPIIEAGNPSWSAPHVYAWIDRHLPKEKRIAAAAYRAAEQAARAAMAHDPDTELTDADWGAKLQKKFAEGAQQ